MSNAEVLIAEADRTRAIPDRVKASELYAKALSLEPNNLYALEQAVEMSFHSGFYAQAEKLCRENLTRFPANRLIRSTLLECLGLLGREEQAYLLAAEYAEAFPHLSSAVAFIARRYAAHGDIAAAEKVLRHEVAEGKGDFIIFSGLYRLYTTHRQNLVPLVDLLATYGPTSLEPCAGLIIQAQALIALQRMEEAEASLVQALSLCPGSDGVIRVRAQLEEARGNWSKALDYWKEYRSIAPGDPDALQYEAECLMRTKRAKEAVVLLELAATLNPKDPNISLTLTHAYLEAYRFLDFFRQAAQSIRLMRSRNREKEIAVPES